MGRQPTIFNTDRASQFTNKTFTGDAERDRNRDQHGPGVGRTFDNIIIERLWRTMKYEDVYLRDYKRPPKPGVLNGTLVLPIISVNIEASVDEHQRVYTAWKYWLQTRKFLPCRPEDIELRQTMDVLSSRM